MLYAVVCGTVKVSILMQYLRIFCPPGSKRGYMFWSCWLLIGSIGGFYFSGIFVVLCSCTPIYKFWVPWTAEGFCLDQTVILIGSGLVNVLSDISIILLPQGCIWSLNMTLRHKLRASAIFLIALV